MYNSKIRDNKDRKDTKRFKFILIKNHYKDISMLGILKQLYKIHKINKYQYKDSIRRVVNSKPLRNNVYRKIHFYLHTIKSNSAKCTMLALNKQDNKKQYCRFAKITYNNNLYAVILKKSKFKELTYNKYLSNDYKELMIKAISKEFKLLMGGINEIIIL